MVGAPLVGIDVAEEGEFVGTGKWFRVAGSTAIRLIRGGTSGCRRGSAQIQKVRFYRY